MSQREWQRVKGIENAVQGRFTVAEAAQLSQWSERQVKRLKKEYQPDGTDSVHHGHRGRHRSLHPVSTRISTTLIYPKSRVAPRNTVPGVKAERRKG